MTNILEIMCSSIHKVISRFTDDAWYLSKLLIALGICLNIIVIAHNLGFAGAETQGKWLRILIFIVPIGILYLVISQFVAQQKLSDATTKYNSRDHLVLAWLFCSIFIFPVL